MVQISVARSLAAPLGVAGLALALACSGHPTTPSPSSSTPPPQSLSATSFRLEVARSSDGPATVVSGDSLQLKATRIDQSGGLQDVTATVLWQSSDPPKAVVSPSGLVKSAGEGAVEIMATLEGIVGKFSLSILPAPIAPAVPPQPIAPPAPSCAASSLASYGSSLSALGDVIFNTVTTPFSDCRWTAESDASWLTSASGGRSYDPGRSGSAGMVYTAAPSATEFGSRVGRITVRFTDGTTLEHTVTQAGPSCLFSVSPAQTNINWGPYTGSFSVQATPSSCGWNAYIDHANVLWGFSASGSGVGAGTINYSINPVYQKKNLNDSMTFYIYVVGTNPNDPRARFKLFLR